MSKNNNYHAISGNRVFVKDGEFIEKALRRFKKKVKESGILQDLREHEFYEKPTTERKRKKAAAVNRQKKYQEAQKLSKKPIKKPKKFQYNS